MKVLKETPGGPTIIQIEKNESIIIFDDDGGHVALMPVDPDDDGDEASRSAVEISIAIIALTDPYVRSIIEERITDA